MPPKKSEPVAAVTGIVAPVTILVVVLVILAWGVTKLNEAIPLDIWSFGAGTVIAGLGVLAIAWQKYA